MDQEKPKSPYVGKYVCYDQADGGACWGRIKDEAVVNTMKGEKEVFILDSRWNRHCGAELAAKRYKQFYDMTTSTLQGSEGGDLGVRKIKGDSTLKKEMIDLENDIIDIGDILDFVDDGTLFKAIMSARGGEGKVDGKTALEIGLQAVMSEMDGAAVAEMKRRLGIDF